MKYRKREEKLKLFRKHGLGEKPVARVARSLGMTVKQLKAQCYYYGVSAAYKGAAGRTNYRKVKWSDEDVAFLLKARSEGKSWTKIGTALGRNVSSCCIKHKRLLK